MEKQGSLGAAGGLSGGSPGGAARGGPAGVRGIETHTQLPSGGPLLHDPGLPSQSGGTVTRSPDSNRPSKDAVAPGSRPSQHGGEAAGPGLGSGTSPGGLNLLCPLTLVPGDNGELKVYSPGCSPLSESTRSQSHNCEDRPRSILKHSNSILMQKSPSVDKKSQRWDEMNILATYHPADKDYGSMKVDEPSTPYHRLQDGEEDQSAGSSLKVTPEALAERFATVDTLLPKVLQYGDKSSGAADYFTKPYSRDFDRHRKTHYNEGKFLRAQRTLPLDNAEDSSEGGTSIRSGIQGGVLDLKPRPVERGWAGRLPYGLREEAGLVTSSHILDVKDSSTCRNQLAPAPASTQLEEDITLRRKEYYTKGRYLRSCSYPEPEEDMDDERDSRTNLPCHTSDSQMVSSWCQWLGAKVPSCRASGSSDRERGSSQNAPSRNGRQHDIQRRQRPQEEAGPWKM